MSRDRFSLTVLEVPQHQVTPSRPYQAQVTSMAPLFAAGTAPDLLVFTNWSGAALPPNETRNALQWLLPLDDHLKADRTLALGDFFPSALDLCRHKGQLVAVPLIAVPQMLVYDSQRFALARVERPTSNWEWQRFQDAAHRLTRDTDGDGVPDEYGFSPGANAPAVLLSFLWQSGGDLLSADKKQVTLTEQAALEALEFVAALYRDPAAVAATGPFGGSVGPSGIRFRDAAGDRWHAMTYDTLWALEGGQLAVAELPRGRQRATALAVGATLSVNHKTQDRAVAAAALAALAEEATKELVPPVRRRPPPIVQSLDPRLTPSGAEALLGSLEYSHSLGLGDMQKTSDLLAAVNTHLGPALRDGKAWPGDAARRAGDALQRVIDQWS